MGLGDEIMATAFARIEKERFPERQVVVGDIKTRKATYSTVFDNNPYISDPRKLDPNRIVHFVNHHPYNRPYINHKKSTKQKYVWNFTYKALPGELYFSLDEKKFAKKIFLEANDFWKNNNKMQHKGVICIETSRKVKVKPHGHMNREWGKNNWDQLINKLKKDYLIIQNFHSDSQKHTGIFKNDSNFRVACALLNLCDLYIGFEGAMPHAAAALGKSAVVIFGGWISPKITGYDFHENIYIDIKGSPCGIRDRECEHCNQCRDMISVNSVYNAVIKNINKTL